jgi:cold shock protein
MSRVNGTVKFFNHARGFGFISPEGGDKDVFVHASALERSGVPALNEGDSLLRDRGRQARARQASRERAARLNLSPPRLILNRQAKPAGFFMR